MRLVGGCAGIVFEAQEPGAQCRRDGRLSSMDAELPAGVLDVEVDGALCQAKDAAGFPASLANGYPLKAGQFALCERLHRNFLQQSWVNEPFTTRNINCI